jgi:hypothetical protein
LDVHEVRLRGGWECAPVDATDRTPSRLTLPIRADSLPAGRLRLIRRFNRPPRMPDDPVELRLRQVPGIESIRLNGLALGPISPECSEFDLAPGPLMPRNELAITAKPPRVEVDWGVISLIFGGEGRRAGEGGPPAPHV